MGIIRFLAIAVLVYLGYRTLQKFNKKGNTNLFAKQKQEINSTSDILEEDPVCGKLVPQHQAVIWQHNNKTLYFCSGECCATFQKRQGEKP